MRWLSISFFSFFLLSSSMSYASNIADRLVNDPTLNPSVFVTAVYGYLTGDQTAGVIANWVDNEIVENGGAPLTNPEKADVVAMKNKYDGLSATDKVLYILDLMNYTPQLAMQNISVTVWDDFMITP